MIGRLPPSFGLYVLGVLLGFTGACAIVAPFLFSPRPEVIPLCWASGALMLAAGIGLRRAQLWGWYLAFAIGVTGLAAVVIGIATGDDESWWVWIGPLVIDLMMVLLLFRDRPQMNVAGRA